MIPHRMFPGEFSNSGLKDRVTACRKRVRESRGMLRAPTSTGVKSGFSRTTDAAISPARPNSSQLEVDVVQDEALILIAEPEVGIR
jgi:hypothetical protein